jgi:hypothetical protein
MVGARFLDASGFIGAQLAINRWLGGRTAHADRSFSLRDGLPIAASTLPRPNASTLRELAV